MATPESVRASWGTLSIPFEFLQEAYKAEDELTELGVDFDTGAGFGMRDWELDWSLDGMTPEQVRDWLKEKYPKLAEASKWAQKQ